MKGGGCLKLFIFFFFFFLCPPQLCQFRKTPTPCDSRDRRRRRLLVLASDVVVVERASVTPPTTHCSLTQLPVMRTHTPCTHTHRAAAAANVHLLLATRGKKSLLVNSVATMLSVLSESLFAGTTTHTPIRQTHTHHTQPLSAVCIRLYILKGIPYCAYQQNATGTCTER